MQLRCSCSQSQPPAWLSGGPHTQTDPTIAEQGALLQPACSPTGVTQKRDARAAFIAAAAPAEWDAEADAAASPEPPLREPAAAEALQDQGAWQPALRRHYRRRALAARLHAQGTSRPVSSLSASAPAAHSAAPSRPESAAVQTRPDEAGSASRPDSAAATGSRPESAAAVARAESTAAVALTQSAAAQGEAGSPGPGSTAPDAAAVTEHDGDEVEVRLCCDVHTDASSCLAVSFLGAWSWMLSRPCHTRDGGPGQHASMLSRLHCSLTQARPGHACKGHATQRTKHTPAMRHVRSPTSLHAGCTGPFPGAGGDEDPGGCARHAVPPEAQQH